VISHLPRIREAKADNSAIVINTFMARRLIAHALSNPVCDFLLGICLTPVLFFGMCEPRVFNTAEGDPS
jgi:hypothetical protein